MEHSSNGLLSLSRSGSRAAALLALACRSDLDASNSPQLVVVRDLAESLADQLEVLSEADTGAGETANFLAEAALRCADLANLAACNLSELSEGNAPKAAATVYLAAGTARALSLLAAGEARVTESTHTDRVMRDARGARWRADVTVRQVEEFAGRD